MAAASGESRSVIRVEESARRHAGELLQRRRSGLGYGGRWRRAFALARGINPRLIADIENAAPGRNFLISTVQDIARAYGVTYESLAAVLAGRARELVPEGQPVPPPSAPAQAARGRPGEVWERVWELAGQGVTDPSGAQVFPDSPADARVWDDISGRWTVPERVRMISEVWVIAAARSREDAPGRHAAG